MDFPELSRGTNSSTVGALSTRGWGFPLPLTDTGGCPHATTRHAERLPASERPEAYPRSFNALQGLDLQNRATARHPNETVTNSTPRTESKTDLQGWSTSRHLTQTETSQPPAQLTRHVNRPTPDMETY